MKRIKFVVFVLLFPATLFAQNWAELDSIAMAYYEQGDYANAIVYKNRAVDQAETEFGEKHDNYITGLNFLAEIYFIAGQIKPALEATIAARNLRYEVSGSQDSEYIQLVNNTGLCYYELGNFDSAFYYYEEARILNLELSGENTQEYIATLNNLAMLYQQFGNNESAVTLYNESITLHLKYFSSDSTTYALLINNLAWLYQTMGNYEEALMLFDETKNLWFLDPGPEHPDYALVLNNLGLIYTELGEYERAMPLLLESKSVRFKALGPDHPLYGQTIGNLAILYSKMGNSMKALEYLQDQREIYFNRQLSQHPAYALTIFNTAEVYLDLGHYEKALSLHNEAKDIRLAIYGSNHLKYAISLNYLGILNTMLGDPVTAMENFNQANTIINNDIKGNFSFMTKDEKEKYFSTMDYTFDLYNSFLYRFGDFAPNYAARCFDNELLRKGLILNSVTNLQQSIQMSGDELLIENYNLFRSVKQQIIYWKEKPLTKQTEDLEYLTQLALDLEKELVNQSRDFALTEQQFSLNWSDIKKNLKENEAGVEFISFEYFNGNGFTDSTLYCALVVRQDYEYPEMVYLFEQHQIDNLLSHCKSDFGHDKSFVSQLYTRGVDMLQTSFHGYGGELYELVWQPIEDLLDGVSTVYFSPSGSLNQVAFAAIPDEDGSLLMDHYKLVQFSSTRKLAIEAKEKDIYSPSFAIYGDIDYTSNTTQMSQEALAYSSSDNVSRYPNIESQDTIHPFNPLPGTLEEIKSISGLLQKYNLTPYTFTQSSANEESFKFLSGMESPDVIHIASHGFFFPNPKINPNEISDLGLSGQMRFALENDPLMRSGLVLAGANAYWMGETLPGDIEDGLLTAMEVSAMNLSNTRLVVLSACETGLGEIKGSEGVFGLQRGFKIAGVNTLIMSLWKVPDNETAFFMKTFYDEWLSGMDMRDAFITTQEKMRTIYPDDPYKWAAFVMVE